MHPTCPWQPPVRELSSGGCSSGSRWLSPEAQWVAGLKAVLWEWGGWGAWTPQLSKLWSWVFQEPPAILAPGAASTTALLCVTRGDARIPQTWLLLQCRHVTNGAVGFGGVVQAALPPGPTFMFVFSFSSPPTPPSVPTMSTTDLLGVLSLWCRENSPQPCDSWLTGNSLNPFLTTPLQGFSAN